MATMKPSKEAEGEGPNPRATNLADYNSEIDAIREKEFPMLRGRLIAVQRGMETHATCRSDLSRPRRHNSVPKISHG